MNVTPIIPLNHDVSGPVLAGSPPFDLVRRLEVPVWVFDIDKSCIVFANASACALWQAETEAELRARDLGRDMSTAVAKRLKQYQSDFLNEDATFTELWTLYPNGDPKSVMVVYRGYRLSDGRMAMQCEAIGEPVDQPDNLRSTEALLHTDVKITLFSRAGPPLYLNPAARNAFMAPLTSVDHLFVDLNDYQTLMAQVDAVGEYRLVTKLHTVLGRRWYDLSAKGCSDAATGDPAILLTAIDVTELKEARDTARYLADRDQLTNLYNRSYLQNHLAKLEAEGNAVDCTVIFFDVDRFKLVNDRHGHEAGDTVLKQIALRTRAAMRAQDVIARLGGDEFIILIEGHSTREALELQVERLRRAISKPIMHDKSRFDISVSVGVATYRTASQTFSEVMREADIALYASKQAGRDGLTFFNTEMGEAVRARDQMEFDLVQAVARGEFELHYQPRLDIQSRTIVSAEGLVRWMHPDHGEILPNVFIPICEETGLIEELGRFVLDTGVNQAIAWQAAGIDISLSLNVSPRQFADPGFVTTLQDLASRPDFPQGKIELEITETVLIGDHNLIADKLRSITAMGYRIAIDDFGTGYSNLSYISRFPLTCLKIDRSFIDQLPESGPVVQLILTLGQQVGATVVSEGVETQAQLDWLTSNNCEEAQGFFITPPLNGTDFRAFIDGFAKDTPTPLRR